MQVVVDPSAAEAAYTSADALRNEWVVAISGEVQLRPAGTENPRIATGGVEIHATDVDVLNPSKTPPFYINEESDVDESLRLRYRYLDLRRERMAANLVLRHRVVKYIRDFLDERGLPGSRDTDADEEHAGGRKRLSCAVPRPPRASSMRSRNLRNNSSSC